MYASDAQVVINRDNGTGKEMTGAAGRSTVRTRPAARWRPGAGRPQDGVHRLSARQLVHKQVEVADGVDNDCDGLDREAGWEGSAYLAICPGKFTREAARNLCLSGGFDGLATIASASEFAFTATLHNRAGVSSDRTWIGYSDAATEGVWVWDSGLATTYTNWLSSEPNGGETENCTLNVALNPVGWGDFPCDRDRDNRGFDLGAACEVR